MSQTTYQTIYYSSAVFLGVVIFLFLNSRPTIIHEKTVPSLGIKRSIHQLKGDYKSTLSYGTLKLLADGRYWHKGTQGMWKTINMPQAQILVLTPYNRHAIKNKFLVTAYGMLDIHTKEKFVKKRHY